jgi:hypothetical protein
MSRLNNLQNESGIAKLSLAFAVGTIVLVNTAAFAGSNSFFGANAGGSGSGSSGQSSGSSSNGGDVDETNVNAGLPGLTAPPAMPPAGDYTDDEKRMQKKYKGNISRAKELIAKGEGMMKSAGKDDKTYKKGKILKETGEKWLTELKTNDPYANEKPVNAGGGAKK